MWFCYFLLSIGALQVQAEKRQQILTETFNEGQGGDASIRITGTGRIGKSGKTSLNINVQIGGGVGLGNIGGMGPRRRPGRLFPRPRPRPRPKFPTKGGRYPLPTQGPITGTPPSGVPTSGTPTSGTPTSGIPTGGATTGTPGGGGTGGLSTGTPPSGVPTSGPPTSGIPTGGATTGTPGVGATGEFTQEEELGLAKHNEFRQVHQVPPMTLDRQMCDQAKEYAKTLVSMGTLKHSSKSEREGQGENLSMGCSTNAPQAMETAVINWYNEVCDPGYDFNNGGFSSGTGHFTQVVWKGSTVLGMGRAEGEMRGMKCAFIVGRYKPAGNMMGDFPQNVPKGNYDPSYCKTVESKRKRYFDENGKAVLINAPFTEVDIPTVRNGPVQHPPRPVFELLNSKKKKKTYVGSRHH